MIIWPNIRRITGSDQRHGSRNPSHLHRQIISPYHMFISSHLISFHLLPSLFISPHLSSHLILILLLSTGTKNVSDDFSQPSYPTLPVTFWLTTSVQRLRTV